MDQIHCFISGRVQGVGFRAFVLQNASALELIGWCRNVGWDRVEVLAEGDRVSLEKLLEILKIGPGMSRVENVEVTWNPAAGEFDQFRVR